ncbi:MAG TPA: TonB-dependent receptor plug domain-containing protein, partial [Gemmatimonadaceae bacterium]|nr:TonB-dependent receptor plug domain-containing protein [Gemmatimonadaceae bacterium]
MGWLLAAALVVASPSTLRAQQGVGTVAGRVTERGPGQPVSEAQVFIVGTTLGGRTGPDGQFSIRNVPAGVVRVRVLRIGYSEQTRPVTVSAGESVTADFALVRTAVQLQAVVTTATGAARRAVEEGNVINAIAAADVARNAPVTNVSDVLNARAPGVVITSGSGTGTGSRIRIRGANSMSLSNDPIYIIDGIRMTNNAGSTSLGTGGPAPSRVNDINPDEIESIEVVKGPSAATLYGTDAANGVIVITTKRGQAGPARWNAWAERGLIEDRVNNYPTNYTLTGHSPSSTTNRVCTLPQVGRGACIMDSVRTYSVFGDPDATPLGTGNRYQTGLSVAGGTPVVTYFLSGELEEENGLIELPAFERRRFQEAGTAIDPWVNRPNALDKRSFRVNVNAAVTPKLDIGVNTGYVNLTQRYQLDMNATAGLGSHLFGG